MAETQHDYDYLVVGSGFGGSVSALRLAEKGWRVALVEQGRSIGPAEISRAKDSVRHLLWSRLLRLKGYFAQHVFQHLIALGGVGVGGGSLVWGSVMLEPKAAFYRNPSVCRLGVDWEAELAPHFATARRMLGVTCNPYQSEQDEFLRETAESLGAGESFGRVPNAIYFGSDPGSGKDVGDDPYFSGEGPARAPCQRCGGCLTGCEFGAKNSLDYNYLYFARKRGVEILTERRAERIEPLPGGGYRVQLLSTGGKPGLSITTKKLVLSAGVIGTLEILLRNRDSFGTLPQLSPALGRVVRTNSEAITAVLHPPGSDMTRGASISSDFYPDGHTHVTQNRFDRGYRFMRTYVGPMVDGERRLRRAMKTLLALLMSPRLIFSNLFTREWEKRLTVLTVMQDKENHLAFGLARTWYSPLRPVLVSQCEPAHRPPSYLPVANEVTRAYAAVSGGRPMNMLLESILGKSTTAHILSGCPMGADRQHAVIDTRHEVHGYPGLYVVDGSSIPANIGVNPSLTITAMAERFAVTQPERQGAIQ